MTVEARLAAADGCARTGTLVRTSADRRELTALVDAARVVRVGRGVYALPGAAGDVIAARLCSGSLTCVSAAVRRGLPVLAAPARAHVAVPGHRGAPVVGRHLSGAVVHWTSHPLPRHGVLAPLPTALVHAMACLPLRDAVALLDAALHRGLVSEADLQALRPRSGRLAFDRVLRAADGRSASLPETVVRLALLAQGLRVEPQVQIRGVGRVDLLVEDLVVVEVDGFAYHSGRGQYREDRRRDRVLHLLGLPVLRFTYEDAVHRTGRTVADVVAMVATARRPGERPVAAERAVRTT